MNWDAVSFDWNQVRAFLAAADQGSFSAASKALRTTQPTISRQVSGLEESLGVNLFDRGTRGLALTQVGQELVAHVRSMGEIASLISMIADGKSQEVTGEVVVSATDLMITEILPTLLAGLRLSAPGLSLRLACSNDVHNLLQREADIAVRHVRPMQSDLVAQHIGNFGANLYASTEYLDRVGRPLSFGEVGNLTFIGAPDPERLLMPLRELGVAIREESFMLHTDSGMVSWALTNSSYGVSMLPYFLATRHQGIEQVFVDLPSPQYPIWLVTHRELRTSRKIRLVFDTLASGLTQLLKSTDGTT